MHRRECARRLFTDGPLAHCWFEGKPTYLLRYCVKWHDSTDLLFYTTYGEPEGERGRGRGRGRERELAVTTSVLVAFDPVARQAGDLYEALVTETAMPQLMLGEFSLALREIKRSRRHEIAESGRLGVCHDFGVNITYQSCSEEPCHAIMILST